MRDTVVINVIPPSQSNEQTAGYIFHRPKVSRQQQYHEYKACNERINEPTAEHVCEYGHTTEK